MTALHDETRSRWGAYPPDQFIRIVMHGAVRNKVELASVVIHVYTQIIHQFPGSSGLRLKSVDEASKEPTRLRDLFLNMRACMADALSATQGDTHTLLLPYTPERYIRDMSDEIRRYVVSVERWARMIEKDKAVAEARLPGTRGGKSFGEVADEILKNLNDIVQLLDFARDYAENRAGTMTLPVRGGTAAPYVN
ncbi:MAG: hypothetical protein ABI690_00125 [Chloroflexota bacterium]